MPLEPRTSSPLEAAYVAAWNARYSATTAHECMEYCALAMEHLDKLHHMETNFVRLKIGEAQRHWGLQ